MYTHTYTLSAHCMLIFTLCLSTSSGIYETVKLRRLGFCYRIKHESFLKRYYICASDLKSLLSSLMGKSASLHEKCVKLLNNIEGVNCSDWQVGNSKVFLNEIAVSYRNNFLCHEYHAWNVNIQTKFTSFFPCSASNYWKYKGSKCDEVGGKNTAEISSMAIAGICEKFCYDK